MDGYRFSDFELPFFHLIGGSFLTDWLTQYSPGCIDYSFMKELRLGVLGPYSERYVKGASVSGMSWLPHYDVLFGLTICRLLKFILGVWLSFFEGDTDISFWGLDITELFWWLKEERRLYDSLREASRSRRFYRAFFSSSSLCFWWSSCMVQYWLLPRSK